MNKMICCHHKSQGEGAKMKVLVDAQQNQLQRPAHFIHYTSGDTHLTLITSGVQSPDKLIQQDTLTVTRGVCSWTLGRVCMYM